MVSNHWRRIDWDQPRPDVSQLAESWSRIEWAPAPLDLPVLNRYVELVRALFVNGGCLVGRWKAVHYDDTAVWFLSRNRFDEYQVHRTLFEDPAVQGELTDLRIPSSLAPVPGGLKEEWAGALKLDGLLAGLLVSGGAYRRFEGPAAEAKDLAIGVSQALIGRRYEDCRLDIAHEAWTPWFHGIAWDTTLVITDRGNAEVTVICITDTD